MNGLKNYKIMGVVMIMVIGLAIEGLRHFQLQSQTQDEIGRAGDLYAVTHETSTLLHEKNLRRPRAEQIKKIQKINAPRGVKFDLKAAIKDYQKEHGLELTKDGARKRPDKLKGDSKKAKKKKNSKYEYVFDMKRGRWVKRLKLTPEQKEALLAKKQAELLEKMKAPEETLAGLDEDSNVLNNPHIVPDQKEKQGKKSDNVSKQDDKKESLPTDVDGWMRLLEADRPDKSALGKLIQAYQSHKVIDDVFYGVIDKLIDYPNADVKQEALLLIDGVRASVRSFRSLVKVFNDDANSSLFEGANKIMADDYTTIPGLQVLEKVLNPQETKQVLLAATQQLNLTVKKLMMSEGDPASYASNFTDFVTLLQELSQQGGEVSTQATRTLALLQSSFNIQTVASNAPSGV